MVEKDAASKDFRKQVLGYGLTTAQILYRTPDHPSLLQTYVWQDYDLFPTFPALKAGEWRPFAAMQDLKPGYRVYLLGFPRCKRSSVSMPMGQTINSVVCHMLKALYSAAVWGCPCLPQ
jgi:hypothetical protein